MKEHTYNERVVKVVGIDLAKRSFDGYGVDERGRRVISKTFTRTRLKEFMIHLPACTVAMKACGSAHYWARQFRDYGHEVRLIAPQFVKPYVKSNKNDAIDAEAICEAVQRPNALCRDRERGAARDPGDPPDARFRGRAVQEGRGLAAWLGGLARPGAPTTFNSTCF